MTNCTTPGMDWATTLPPYLQAKEDDAGYLGAPAVVAGIAAYLSVRFLSKWFHTRTLWPFAMYSVIAGVASIIYFAN